MLEIWYQRLAHADRRVITRMAQNGVAKDMDMSKLPTMTSFPTCIQETMANTSMRSCRHVEMQPGVMVHPNDAEMNKRSKGTGKYFLTFIDEPSGFVRAIRMETNPIKKSIYC